MNELVPLDDIPLVFRDCGYSWQRVNGKMRRVLTPAQEAAKMQAETQVKVSKQQDLLQAAAIKKIHDERLYLADHSNFKDYVEKVLRRTRSETYNLLILADMREVLKDSGLPLPDNKSQAYALSHYTTPCMEGVKAIWAECHKDDTQVTAKKINTIANKVCGYAEIEYDGEREVIPYVLRPVFKQKLAEKCAKQIKKAVSTLMRCGPRIQPWLDEPEDLIMDLDFVYGKLMEAIPYKACPECQAAAPDCETCRGTGYLPEWRYQNWLARKEREESDVEAEG